MTISREHGLQPLDALLISLELSNADLVTASTEQLSFKMLTRGRKGRLLTAKVQRKVCNALNACQSDKVYEIKDLFNYKSR